VTFIDVKTHKPRAEEQFKFEVNEISWNNDGDLFFLTSGQGSIHILRYRLSAAAVYCYPWIVVSEIVSCVLFVVMTCPFFECFGSACAFVLETPA